MVGAAARWLFMVVGSRALAESEVGNSRGASALAGKLGSGCGDGAVTS